MKHLSLFLFCVLASLTTAVAQAKIKASDIIKQINEGRSVEYSNVDIVGELDLTNLENRRLKRSGTNLFDWGNDTYESDVEVSFKFTNCTFQDDVLAYYHIERSGETFIAHFDKDAVFKNCVFKKSSEFKYTEFNSAAVFSGCTFNREANFKYAEFSSGPQFASTRFESGADFKYTHFPQETSFENASFYGLANFKYTKFESPLNMKGVAFKGDEDFKYTKIDGRSFTSYLLDGR